MAGAGRYRDRMLTYAEVGATRDGPLPPGYAHLRVPTRLPEGSFAAAAEAELARLDGARTGGLSDSERRIVELVRQGSTNREIARSTYLSVKAVEANLTRLYRRFGVRTRDQLARVLDEER